MNVLSYSGGKGQRQAKTLKRVQSDAFALILAIFCVGFALLYEE
jgi:hypothetical protein